MQIGNPEIEYFLERTLSDVFVETLETAFIDIEAQVGSNLFDYLDYLIKIDNSESFPNFVKLDGKKLLFEPLEDDSGNYKV